MVAALNIRRISWIDVHTEDTTQAIAFFRDALGLETVRENILQLPSGDFVELSPGERGFTAGFLVDDIEEARAELEAAGAEMIEDVGRSGGYAWFRFRAPDGTVFGVMQG